MICETPGTVGWACVCSGLVRLQSSQDGPDAFRRAAHVPSGHTRRRAAKERANPAGQPDDDTGAQETLRGLDGQPPDDAATHLDDLIDSLAEPDPSCASSAGPC